MSNASVGEDHVKNWALYVRKLKQRSGSDDDSPGGDGRSNIIQVTTEAAPGVVE